MLRTVLKVILVLTAVLVALVTMLYFDMTSFDEEGFERSYNARVDAALKARDQQRHASGWALVPGEAASDYRRAHEACDLHTKEEPGLEADIQLVVAALLSKPTKASMSPWTPPPACGKLGLLSEHRGQVTRRLSDRLCQRIERCEVAIALVQSGSRRAQPTSPLSVLSDWAMESHVKGRNMRPFLVLMKLALIHNHLDNLGSAEKQLEGLMGLLRFATDLASGARLHPTVEAAKMLRLGTSALERLIEANLDDTNFIQRARQALGDLNRRPISFRASLDAEYLATLPLWTMSQGLQRPPAALSPPEAGDFFERIFVKNALKTQASLLTDYMEASGRSDVHRSQRYKELHELQRKHSNTLVRMATIDYGHYDAPISMAATRLLLLELGTAALVYRSQRGRLPDSLVLLRPLLGLDKLPRDPLVGAAFEMEHTTDGVRIYSRGLDPENSRALGIVDKHLRQGLDFVIIKRPEAL